jgi:disulfide bond formation protein DsbB
MKYVLILCLLLSQTLGLVHSIEHAQHHSKPVTVQATQQTDVDHNDLFAGHNEETTCQLYDQLSLGGALVGNVATLSQATPESMHMASVGQCNYTHQRSLVQARAPPAVLLVS